MANESGSTVATQKAAEKSVGVTGHQAAQMLLKREAASKTATIAVNTDPTPPKEKEAPNPAPSEGTLKTSPTEKTETVEAKVETPEPEPTPSDDVLSTLSLDQKERIQRRIDKEVGKRKSLEDEVARLRALGNAIAPNSDGIPRSLQTIPQPSSNGPLAGITDMGEIDRRVDEALEVKDWAQAQLDAEVPEARLGDKVYDKQALRNAVRNSEKFIQRDAPKQRQFVAQKAQVDRQTAELFGSEPWMQDRTSEGYVAYQQLMRNPEVAKFPNASWVAAVQVQGLLDVQKRMKAAKGTADPIKVPDKPKAPSSQTAQGGGFAPPREAGSSRAVAELTQAMEKLKGKKGVTGREAEAYFLKMEQSRTR